MTTCPRCSCELQPGTEHHCAETKAPTARAIADELWLTRKDVAALDAKFGQLRDEIGGLRDIVWDQLGESDAEKKGTVDARLEALERECSDLFGYEPPRSANHENTGAAVRDNASGVHADGGRTSAGKTEDAQSAAEDVGSTPASTHPHTSRSEADGLTGGASGGGLDRNATPREGRCPDPAASALPMPERPTAWARKNVDGEHYIEAGAFYAMRERCIALESRLAEITADRDSLKRRVDELTAQLSSIRKAGETWAPEIAACGMPTTIESICAYGREAINQDLAEAEAASANPSPVTPDAES